MDHNLYHVSLSLLRLYALHVVMFYQHMKFSVKFFFRNLLTRIIHTNANLRVMSLYRRSIYACISAFLKFLN